MKTLEEAFENGYQNGICFGYIPDMTHEQMQEWGRGYRAAVSKRPLPLLAAPAAASALLCLTGSPA